MRIGIDGRALHGFIEGSRAGVGRYVYELCRELDLQLPDAKFFVYSATAIEMPVLSDRWILRLDTSAWARCLKPVLWSKFRCGKLCKVDELNVFWGAATFLPVLPKAVRTIITVYDLNFKIVPRTMSRLHRLAYQLFFKGDILKADLVTTISKGTSDRMYKYFKRSADAVVYPAVGKQFKSQSESSIKNVLEKYGVNKPYLLAVGTREPRKNLELLVRAFRSAKENGALLDHLLVLVGGRGWKDRRLSDLIVSSDSVIHLGYIPDGDLSNLYSGADVFIFPSIYEGFGIPVAEARACGAKVVATDSQELREAGGEESIYVRLTTESIQEGIRMALDQPKPRGNIVQTNNNSWENGARVLSSSILSLIFEDVHLNQLQQDLRCGHVNTEVE